MPEFTVPQLLALAKDALSNRPKMYKKGGTVEHKGVSITHAELSPQALHGGAVWHPEHFAPGGGVDPVLGAQPQGNMVGPPEMQGPPAPPMIAAPPKRTIGSMIKRGVPIQPSTPDPTPQELAAARADTRGGGDIVARRLDTIVPESKRVVGGTYTPGAPNGGRWSDLPHSVLEGPGLGFKFSQEQRDAEQQHARTLNALQKLPNSKVAKEAHQASIDRLEKSYAHGDAMLQDLWNQSVAESSQAAKNSVKASNARPTFGAKDWDSAMRLPIRDHLWYELSGEKFAENMPDLTPEEHLKMVDVVGATSARADPKENLERTLAVMSQHMRNAPIDVDLTQPGTVSAALGRSHEGGTSALSGNKTGHFSDTLALTGGVPTRFPISVNDVWVGRMFGVPDDVMSSNQSLHEPMAIYFNKIRDLYNELHKDKLPFKYQSWNFQAPSWVHLRPNETGDAYHQVWGGIIKKAENAGIPGLEGEKIRREAFMHPGFADALRATTPAYRSAPKATVELGTKLTPTGNAAFDAYKKAKDEGDELSQYEYTKALTSAMHSSGRGKLHPWDALKKAITGDLTSASDITRIAHGTADRPFDVGGSFEGDVSPNIRVPLKGMSDDDLAIFNAIPGHHLNQAAMAISQIHGAYPTHPPKAGYIRGHSLFVPTTEQMQRPEIENFAKTLPEGHDISYGRHPNGYLFDINPKFTDDGAEGIDYDDLLHASKTAFGDKYGHTKILAHDYRSVYTPSDEYAGLRQKLIKRIEDDYIEQAQRSGLKKSKARQALVKPQLASTFVGGSRKDWNTYQTRLGHLDSAENGFKDLAQSVEDANQQFVKRAAGRAAKRKTAIDKSLSEAGYARGGGISHGPHMPHPAMRIPGVHIVTSEAGEPFFHG